MKFKNIRFKTDEDDQLKLYVNAAVSDAALKSLAININGTYSK